MKCRNDSTELADSGSENNSTGMDGGKCVTQNHHKHTADYGTIAVTLEVQLTAESFYENERPDATPDGILNYRLSQSHRPVLRVGDRTFIYMMESPIRCNWNDAHTSGTAEVEVFLTPYPFKAQDLSDSIGDADLIAAMEADVRLRLADSHVSGCDVLSFGPARVVTLSRNADLPQDLLDRLGRASDEAKLFGGTFDWSQGIIPEQELQKCNEFFERVLAATPETVPPDGLYHAQVHDVLIEKETLDGVEDLWSAQITWCLKGLESQTQVIVGKRWYFPTYPEAQERDHIFAVLKPWLGDSVVTRGDLDLHSLIGSRCQVMIIREYFWYYEPEGGRIRRIYPSIRAVLPADFEPYKAKTPATE